MAEIGRKEKIGEASSCGCLSPKAIKGELVRRFLYKQGTSAVVPTPSLVFFKTPFTIVSTPISLDSRLEASPAGAIGSEKLSRYFSSAGVLR
jgi:hypothetical protein